MLLLLLFSLFVQADGLVSEHMEEGCVRTCQSEIVGDLHERGGYGGVVDEGAVYVDAV